MIRENTIYRVGQTWVDKKRNPTWSFTILKLYDKHYKNGESALRIKGVVCDEHSIGLRDLDSRSFEKMLVKIIFDPPIYVDSEDRCPK